MAMETFSLIDDEGKSREKSDLHPYEKSKTGLVRADLGNGGTHDPIRRGIDEALQRFKYSRTRGKVETDQKLGTISHPSQDAKKLSYRNTALLAEILLRTLASLMTALSWSCLSLWYPNRLGRKTTWSQFRFKS